MILTRTNKEQLLSSISQLVQKRFYDPQFNHKNWFQLVSEHRERIIDSGSSTAFEQAVASLFEELNSSGLGLLGEHTQIAPRNSISASFRRIDALENDRWVFQDVQPGGVAELAGLTSGDTLVSISGRQIRPPEGPQFAMHERIPVVVSRNGQQKQLEIEIKTPRPKYDDNPYAEPNSAVVKTLGENNDTGYLKVSLFPGKIGIDFANRLDFLFENPLKNVKRLIVDLRGNPGGGIGNVRLMSYLTGETVPIGYSLDRRSATDPGFSPQRLPRFSRIPRSKFEIPLLALKYGGKTSVVLQTEGLGPKSFHGKVVVLINEHSSGAAEMVAQFAKENQLALIVGVRSAGRVAARSAFKIGLGYRVTIPIAAYLTWHGFRIEGRGITPDVEVDWSFPDAVQGRDSQLDQALAITKSL